MSPSLISILHWASAGLPPHDGRQLFSVTYQGETYMGRTGDVAMPDIWENPW
jgi:hypothetical protein